MNVSKSESQNDEESEISRIPGLQSRRKSESITQEKFGKIFGLSGATISKYENGFLSPSIGTLKAFAEYFNCTTDELLTAPERGLE